MQFEYTPYIIPLIAAALISAAVAVFARARRSVGGALALFHIALSLVIWTVGYALEIAATDPDMKYVWGTIQYFGIALAPYAWLVFSITFAYGDSARILTKRFFFLTAPIPTVTILLALTTKWHGLIWSEYHVAPQADFSALVVSRGLWFWVHFAYSYILILAGSILIGRALFKRQGLYRGQAAALLVAVLAPWVGNALYLTGNSPIPYLDLTPFAFTVTAAALAWAIFGFRLVEIAPIARELIVERMRDGVIVLNARGFLVDINPAAAAMIGITAAMAIGRHGRDVFSPWPHLIERFRDVMEADEQFTVGSGNAQRHYQARFSPLADARGHAAGRLMILRALEEGETAARSESQPQVRIEAEPSVRAEAARSPRAERERKRRPAWIAWLVDFFLPPLRTDLADLPDADPGLLMLERTFTIILRFAAVLAPIDTILSRAEFENFPAGYWAFLSVEFCLGILAIARSIPFKARAIGALLAFYIFSVIETALFGYTPEGFIIFIIVVVSAGTLIGIRGGWIALAAILGTLGAFGWQMAQGNFVPLALDRELASPLSFRSLTVLFTFAATAAGLNILTTVILANLRRALWQEMQAVNLLQRERDLLEQRVTERTQDLAESESRYRHLFVDSPLSLWEEDFSLVKEEIERLRRAGISDFREYFESAPDEVTRFTKLVKVTDVNAATLKSFRAR